MIGRMKVVLIVGVIFFGMSGMSFAMSCCADDAKDSSKAHGQNAGEGSKGTDAGNKTYPASGGTAGESPKGYGTTSGQDSDSGQSAHEGHHH